MGTVIPTGIINLLKGVPLDNKYNDTLYNTGNQQSQVANFLASFTYLTYNNHEYQRVNEGVLRLNEQIANVYNVNYMIFKNIGTGAQYEDHWFFAFVNRVEYVNERAVNIYYEIDVFQTYCFDWTLEPCMVERTHVTSDTFGEHNQAEPVNVSRYDIAQTVALNDNFVNAEVCIATTTRLEPEIGTDPMPNVYGGCYSGVRYYLYNIDNTEELNLLNQRIQERIIDANASDSVISMTMVPRGLFNVAKTSRLDTFPVTVSKTTLINGYIPKNKKLLCYPYNYFVIDCVNDSHEYRYEWFEQFEEGGTAVQFNVHTSISPDPEIIIAPNAYRSSVGSNVCEGITMCGFPQCAFTIDSYRAWLAQKSTAYNITQGTNVVQTGLSTIVAGTAIGSMIASGGATAPLVGAAVAGAGGVASGIGNMLQEYNQKVIDTTKGSTARGNINATSLMGARLKKIYIRRVSVTYDIAQSIDDFFTRYGYTVNRIQMPNLAARKAFTYIKTNGMSIRGNIPADDIAKINSCFDRGITFFRALANVGNYSVDNTL